MIENSTAQIESKALTRVSGIDISKFQGNEVVQLKDNHHNVTFIICKATEGITYTDPKFSSNWKAIKSEGFIRGTYHFYRSLDDPIKQADHYTNAISALTTSDIPPVVDFEQSGIEGNQTIEAIQQNLKSFLSRVESNLKRKPMIYTNLSVGNKYLNSEYFAEYALWIAEYSLNQEPQLPEAWNNKEWSFWQRSSDYKIEGTQNDFDLFNGTKAELLQFIQNY